MITKILKNKTNQNIILINLEIPAEGQLFIEHTMWSKLIQNGKVFDHINNGILVVNDGVKDLDISQAISHMYLFQDEIPVSGKHFSYRKILSGVTVTVPEEQQMVEYQEICIQNTGELNIEGEVVIIL